MRGLITNREVLSNLPLIVSEFGAGCVWRWFRAMVLRERTTFLEIAVRLER